MIGSLRPEAQDLPRVAPTHSQTRVPVFRLARTTQDSGSNEFGRTTLASGQTRARRNPETQKTPYSVTTNRPQTGPGSFGNLDLGVEWDQEVVDKDGVAVVHADTAPGAGGANLFRFLGAVDGEPRSAHGCA